MADPNIFVTIDDVDYNLKVYVTNLAGELLNYQLLSEKAQIDGYPSLDGTGKIPIEQLPDAVSETPTFDNVTISSVTPYLTTKNTTAEDGDGGRINLWIAQGTQSGAELTTLGNLEFAHDGALDDEKGKLTVRLNNGSDGTSPTVIAVIDSTGLNITGNIAVSGTVDGIDISSYIDQSVVSGSTPTFTGTNFSAIPQSGVTNLTTDLGNKQPLDTGLTSISGLTTDADKMIYTTALDVYAVTDLTAAGRALLDDATAAAQRITLGVGTTDSPSFAAETLSSISPYLTTTNTTAEDASGGRESKWIAKGTQSGAELTTLGEIEFSHDGALDDEKGKLIIKLNDGNDGNSPTSIITALSSGYIGIGASTPLSRLHINGGTGSLATGLAFGDGDSGIYESIDDSIYIDVANSTKVIISTSSTQTNQLIPLSTKTYELGGSARYWQKTYTEFLNINTDLDGSAAAPSLSFGDGDSGFYEAADDSIYTSLLGAVVGGWGASLLFVGTGATGNASLDYTVSSSTIPGHAFVGDNDTGIGRADADQLSMIAGGVEGIRVTEADGAISTAMTGDVSISGSLTVSGTSFEADHEITTADTMIFMNAGETGSVVTAGYAGLDIDRGTGNPYRLGFRESSDNTRVGAYYVSVTYDNLSGSFTLHEKVTGGTSGAIGYIFNDTGSVLKLKGVSGTFVNDEVITGETSTETADVDGAQVITDNTQALATREDTPTDNAIAYWDTSTLKFETLAGFVCDGTDVFIPNKLSFNGTAGYIEGDTNLNFRANTNYDINFRTASDGGVRLQINNDKTVQCNTGRIEKVTTVNAATYDLLITDYILNVTYTATGAVTSLTLPTAQTTAGRVIIIKDAGGLAGTNNITIDTEGAETIDGAATLVINENREFKKLYCDGTNWQVLDNSDITTEQWVSVPASSSATGIKGQFAYATGYKYECVATDTWIKFAVITSF